jgi:metal-responsive CopG/Arc/MetJ family transcriptional regulator
MKTEKIEIRIPGPLKEMFQVACEQEGKKVSEVVRYMIRGYIVHQGHETKKSLMRRELPFSDL